MTDDISTKSNGVDQRGANGTHNDPVFFGKWQIEVGSVLRCYGRRNPNTIWEVAMIETFVTRGKRLGRYHSVRVAKKLDDTVYLLCRSSHERKEMRFSSLSYSAIWRLED